MTIATLSVSNFIGCRHFANALAPATVLAGPNESGKSSTLNAIRYALTEDLCRVKLKKELGDLISEGAKASSTILDFADGSAFVRKLPSGDVTGELPLCYHSAALPFVLAPERFAAASVAERRTLLSELTGSLPSRQWVGDRLAQEGLPVAIIEAILPNLRAGFDAAESVAGQKAAEARGAWKAITRETYGSQKAEGWRAERPVVTADAEALRQTIAERENALSAAREALGAAKARAQAPAAAEAPDPAKLKKLAKQVADGEARLAEHQAAYAAAKAIADAPEGIHQSCPECGAALVVDRGTIKSDTGAAGKQSKSEAFDEAKRLAGVVQTAQEWLSPRRAELARMQAQAALAERQAAQAAGDALSGMAAAAGAGDPVELAEKAAAIESDLTRLRADLTAALDAERRVAEAGDLETRAAAEHANVGHWSKAKELLSPNGLPAELLAKAMKPVREALDFAPDGWRVEIGDDMEIRYNGRRYALCSESGRWRADAVIGAALARLSGVPLLLLDRLDVIQPSLRPSVLRWLVDVANSGVQVIAAGTFTNVPAMDGVLSIWMGETEAVTA